MPNRPDQTALWNPDPAPPHAPPATGLREAARRWAVSCSAATATSGATAAAWAYSDCAPLVSAAAFVAWALAGAVAWVISGE